MIDNINYLSSGYNLLSEEAKNQQIVITKLVRAIALLKQCRQTIEQFSSTDVDTINHLLNVERKMRDTLSSEHTKLRRLLDNG